jgi:hypothetical protein
MGDYTLHYSGADIRMSIKMLLKRVEMFIGLGE